MSKPTLATVALGGCEGCHMALIDAHEVLLDLLDVVDLVHSPFSGPDAMPDAVDIVLVEGPVTNEEDRAKLVKARQAATTLVALGSCAVLGGIGGLRNLERLDDVMAEAFGDSASKTDRVPQLEKNVHPLSDFVTVDVTLSGCSPKTELIVKALTALVTGQPFEQPRRNLCEECHREKRLLLQHSKDFVSENVYALMELDEIDANACFIEQGLLCMGPVTREGCGARCTAANVPCRGCSGPSRLEFEQGAKTIDALAALLPAGAIMYMEDLIGTGYRYTVPVSVFPALLDHKEVSEDA